MSWPGVFRSHLRLTPSCAALEEADARAARVPRQKTASLSASKFPRLLQWNVNPVLTNIVAMFRVGDLRLDLRDIAMRCKNAEYHPKRFAACVLRVREPKCTALVFETGKIVVTGATSVEDSKRGCRKFAKILKKLGNPVQFLDVSWGGWGGVVFAGTHCVRQFQVQNMVAVCDMRAPLSLENFASDNAEHTSYEPELFPGAIFRMEQPRVVVLMFVTGKMVFTGAKSEDDIFQACENMYPLAQKYAKKPTAAPGSK